MKPQDFPQSIVTLKGPPGSDIADMPTWTDGRTCLSCWRAGLRERLIFLVTGRAWLWVWSGHTQPPVCVTVEEPTWHSPISQSDPEKPPATEDDIRAIVRATLRRARKLARRGAAVAFLVACSLFVNGGQTNDVRLITPQPKIRSDSTPLYMASLGSMQWRRNTASFQCTTDAPAIVIERSSDLRTWIGVITNSHAALINIAVDTGASQSNGFYRVRSQQ